MKLSKFLVTVTGQTLVQRTSETIPDHGVMAELLTTDRVHYSGVFFKCHDQTLFSPEGNRKRQTDRQDPVMSLRLRLNQWLSDLILILGPLKLGPAVKATKINNDQVQINKFRLVDKK